MQQFSQFNAKQILSILEWLPPTGCNIVTIEGGEILRTKENTFINLAFQLSNWDRLYEEFCFDSDMPIIGEYCKRQGRRNLRALCNATGTWPEFDSAEMVLDELRGKRVALTIEHVFQDGDFTYEVTSYSRALASSADKEVLENEE